MTKKSSAAFFLGAIALAGILFWRIPKVSLVKHSADAKADPVPTVATLPVGKEAVSTSASAVQAAPGKLWSVLKSGSGTPLDRNSTALKAAQLKGEIPLGRAGALDNTGVSSFSALRPGDRVELSLPGGETRGAEIKFVSNEAEGVIRVTGSIINGAGTFTLAQGQGGLSGRILLPQERRAVVVHPAASGKTLLQEVPISAVLCEALPREPNAASASARPFGPQSAPPVLSSRPDASAVVYLDFDGATVTDPDWPAYASDGVTITGPTIVAAPSALTNPEIVEVWERVREDFAPFNIDITTDPTRYAAVGAGHRIRVIITPTDSAAPGAGGQAYIGSFVTSDSTYVGFSYFSSDIPAWVFNVSVDGIAEAISHEVGHTLGLEHDGENPPLTANSSSAGEYYHGHGDPSSPVSWAPIMGAGYDKKLVQWSRGEYPQANNQQDDVGILAGITDYEMIPPSPAEGYPGLYGYNPTYYATDDQNNSRSLATGLSLASGSVHRVGSIQRSGESDFYQVYLNSPFGLAINANPADAYPKQPNLDIAIEVQDLGGAVVGSANPDGNLTAVFSQTLPVGTYYIRVSGAGRSGSGPDHGYSNYGSLGVYTLDVSLIPVIAPVITTSPMDSTKQLGQSASFTVEAIGGGLSYQWYRNGLVIPGATAATLTINSVTADDFSEYFATVSNPIGTKLTKTVYLSYTEAEVPPANAWLDAKEVDGVLYFLFADAPRIERYDLAAETWLSTWMLPRTPQAFAFSGTALYIASGGKTYRYTRSFTGETLLVDGTTPVLAIFDTGTYLLTVTGENNFSAVNSYQLTGQAIATSSGYFRGTKGPSFDAASGLLFGNESSDIGQYQLLPDGTWKLLGFYTYRDSPYHGALPVGWQTFLLPDGTVADNSGTVYRRPDLTYAGSFGTRLSDLISNGAGGYWVLRGNQVFAADAKYRETGSAGLTAVARKVAARSGSLFAFATPASVGARPGVEKLAASLVIPPVAPAIANPVGRVILSPKISGDANGTIYVYSKADRNAFVWSSQTWSYQATLPLSGSGDVVGMGPDNKFYFTRNGTQVRSIAPSQPEQPFVANVAPVIALQGMGQQMAISDMFYNGLPIKLVSSTGDITSTVGDTLNSYLTAHHYTFTFAWDAINSRLFQFRDSTIPNSLLASTVLPGGLLSRDRALPYNTAVTATPPIRVSPDGARIVLGSGQTYVAETMASAGDLGVAVKDVAWAGGAMHTVRASGAMTVLESWSASTLAALGTASFSGEPVSLFSLRADRLLLITSTNGLLTYRMISSATRGVIDATAVGVAPTIINSPADQTITVGSARLFTVTTTGGSLPAYQWQIMLAGGGGWQELSDDNNFQGSATGELRIRNFTVDLAGARLRVVVTNSAGSVSSTPATLAIAGPPAVISAGADLNGDGKADLLWRNTNTNDYAAWLMNGTVASGTASYGLPVEWRVIKAADFDGDGKSDLVWRNSATGAVVLWQMNGTTIGTSTWLYDSGTDWNAEIFADFNGDGKTDILWHNTVNGQYAIWLMNGGTVSSASGFSIGAGWSVAKAADFNGDGKTDLLWRNVSMGGVVMWLQNGTTTASTTWIYDSGTDWALQLFADFNGDGKTDILWHNTVTGQYAFWLMDGATVASASGFSIAAGWSVTNAADFNGDSKADLIWRNGTSGGMVMWIQNGTTTTSTAWIYDSGTAWEIAATKDFNGDGKADILWHNTVTSEYAFWLMNGAITSSASGFSLPAGWEINSSGE